MESQPKKIAVIGAGIAGLTCAYELQKAGYEVTVFEKEARVGGRMSSRTTDGYIFDLGADHLCDLYDEMKKYCQEFGIPWEKMRFLKYGVAKNHTIVPLDQAVSPLSRFRLALQYFFTKPVGDFFDLNQLAEYDTESAYDYMKRRAGKEIADTYVDAFTTTYQFHRGTEMSAGALLGILYSLKKDGPRWKLHRTKGGMQALPDAFASRLNVRTNTTIKSVRAETDHVTVTTDQDETFDAVVFASPAFATRSLYQNPTEPQKAILDQAKYASSISIAYRVPRSIVSNEYAIIWIPYAESNKLTGIVNEAMKGAELDHDGTSIVCTWLHEDFAKSLIGKSDEEIFAAAKDELVRVCPWFTSVDQLQNLDLQRWPAAMPKFYPGWLKAVQNFMQSSQGDQNVFFAGDYLNAPWTEGALRNGQAVAKQVMQSLGRP